MKKLSQAFILSLSGLIFSSCETEINKLSDNAKRDAIEAVVTTIGGALDDVAVSGSRKGIAGCDHAAGACSVTAAGPGATGTRTVNYNCAQDEETSEKLKGKTVLSYTVTPSIGPAPTFTVTDGTPDCTLDIGETVTITGTTTHSGPVPGTLIRSTLNLPVFNLDVPVVGGGTYITRNGSTSLAMTILNKNVRQNLLNGASNVDVSVQTRDAAVPPNLTDLYITGSGARGSRSVTGTVSAYHNGKQFSATYLFTNVTWGDANCCWPTSGSATVTYSGSESGSESISFSGCGAVNIGGAGAELRYCD